MNSKSLLIAIAAFAVTATGAQAFVGGDVLRRAGLSEEQVEALEEARDLRAEGEEKKARDVLVKAGIDESTMASVRTAIHAAREAMHEAVASGDYEAFKEAVANTPLADIVTTEDDFRQFKKAHDLRQSGEYAKAKVIYDELGVVPPAFGAGMPRGMGMGRVHDYAHHGRPSRSELSFGGLSQEQRDALQVARQANDHETVRAILEEAGEGQGKRGGW